MPEDYFCMWRNKVVFSNNASANKTKFVLHEEYQSQSSIGSNNQRI